jgi:Hemopexin
MPMYDYFFSGNQYIRVWRGDTGPGSVDAGYPAPISIWGWGDFGANGIDAALYSGSKCYFFSGNQYIRVSRGITGPGSVDDGYPAPISNWNWGDFGANGIDAALWSGYVCYFFSGNEYIRVRRGDTGPGSVDPGYPAPISNWNWGEFGANGIDGALYSGSKCYFFAGPEYVRVSRGPQGPGFVDGGYPAPISRWNWGDFGANGIDAALYSGGPLAPPPPVTGLVSNHNYYLADGGAALTNVSVTIDFDVDFTSTANGFSIQLNCYAGANDLPAWQQYYIYLQPNSTQLWARIENWVNYSDELLRVDVPLANLPSQTVSAGYQITIRLNNDDSGNITGANYAVTDNSGASLGSTTITILDQVLDNGQPATSADLSPIVALELTIGGDYNGTTATLTGGAGTITYSASNSLTATGTAPSSVALPGWTIENANLIFCPLPASANQSITQSFEATTGGPALSILRERERQLLTPGHAASPP